MYVYIYNLILALLSYKSNIFLVSINTLTLDQSEVLLHHATA